jgi:hypothetical protein
MSSMKMRGWIGKAALVVALAGCDDASGFVPREWPADASDVDDAALPTHDSGEAAEDAAQDAGQPADAGVQADAAPDAPTGDDAGAQEDAGSGPAHECALAAGACGDGACRLRRAEPPECLSGNTCYLDTAICEGGLEYCDGLSIPLNWATYCPKATQCMRRTAFHAPTCVGFCNVADCEPGDRCDCAAADKKCYTHVTMRSADLDYIALPPGVGVCL